MKRIAIISIIFFSAMPLWGQEEKAKDSFYLMSPVEVKAIRAGDNAPFTKTNLTKKEIGKLNLGQDIPFLLNQTPSVVINADGGNGIGYTGIRIRGTDATRINVTLNGIPYNDAESQGTFFVNLPDFTSSAGSVQVQRGVGTSSNGAGAFGASINFSTNEVNKAAYAEINNGAGSFNSWKHTVKAGTGLIDEHFTADIRLSRITSDGFIDRASGKLESFYFSTAWLADQSSLRFNIFSGKEKTYQAWYGISEADLLAGNRTVNYAGMEKPGEPYDNETDNYTQTHYQLFYNQQLSKPLHFNTALFLTRGKGYYEQYKADETYASYGLPNAGNSDFIRQLWLDNYFYGTIFSLQYKKGKTQATLGGALTRYDGDHFGEIIWASGGMPAPTHRWYDLNAQKTDFNIYLKQQTSFSDHWNWFYDLQYRLVDYDIDGFRNSPSLRIDNRFHFFNPKAGISYANKGWRTYLSYGIANKEPNRDDFEAGISQQPKREQLHNIEAAVEKTHPKSSWSATLYYMKYRDQLVLTGKINDVGAYTRTNIPDSYRLGIELQAAAQFASWVNASATLALSRNKVKNFTEYIDDYDNGGQKTNLYTSADIAYSPAMVGNATINFLPVKNTELSLLGKYVSRQYLDNTSNADLSLDAFYVQDIRLIYTIKKNWLKEVNIIAQVNNIFSKKYEPNGYTFSYIAGGGTITENYYFPMAGRNFMLGLNVRL